jgi:hypothetical protein
MSPLDLFGRNRNLAISSEAIPRIEEGIQSFEVIRVKGSPRMEN